MMRGVPRGRERRRARRLRQATLISRFEYSYASSVTTGCVGEVLAAAAATASSTRGRSRATGLSPASSPLKSE